MQKQKQLFQKLRKKQKQLIVADAKAEAKSVQEASEKEIGILKESAAISAEQAKRDAMLAFKTEVQAEFEKILSAKIENNLSDAALGKLIHAVISDEDVKNYAVEVSEVNDSLKAELAEEIKNGLEIRPTKGCLEQDLLWPQKIWVQVIPDWV